MKNANKGTRSSRLFVAITIILLMPFYGLFILLVSSLAKNLANAFLANATFSRSQKSY